MTFQIPLPIYEKIIVYGVSGQHVQIAEQLTTSIVIEKTPAKWKKPLFSPHLEALEKSKRSIKSMGIYYNYHNVLYTL